MREYQEKIYEAILRKGQWGGSNVVVSTANKVTLVYYYGSIIGVIDHNNRTAKCDHCGYYNASTTARINAIIKACKEMGYEIEVI